jgi:hypothetical protein
MGNGKKGLPKVGRVLPDTFVVDLTAHIQKLSLNTSLPALPRKKHGRG